LIQARISDLDDEEKNLLDVASCCGFEFDPALVGRALGMPLIPTLQRFGRIEGRHRLVRSSGRAYAFDHHQVQEALYEGLSEQLREAYHEAIAQALRVGEGVEGTDPSDLDGVVCVDLCEHFLKGRRGEEALPYLNAALDHLERRFLNERAIALADRALETPGILEGRQRLEVLLRKNSRLQLRGRREAQSEVLDESLALARETGDGALLAEVEGAIGRLRWLTGRTAEARDHFERSLALAREAGAWRAEVQATGDVGLIHVRLGRYEDARAMYERNLSLARTHGDVRAEGVATSNLGAVLSRLRRWEEAQERFEQGIALACRIDDRQLEAYPTAALGNLLWSLGRTQEAKPYMERALSLARETGDRNAEANATMGLANLLVAREQFGAALEHYERSLALSRAIGDRELEGLTIGNLGHLLYLLGRREEARARCGEHLALGREVGAPAIEMLALHNLALLRLEDDDKRAAVRLADEADELRRQIGDSSQAGPLMIQLAEIRRRVGDERGAREAIREAIDMSRRHRNAVELAHALALRARLPGERPDEALAALDEAGEGANTPEVRYHLWMATGEHEHLAEAKRRLDYRVEHAPEAYRPSMLENVRMNREIMDAWERSRDPEGT
ncbi:MAG: tetratricopeptide repeat protein, partial [Planctomycetota bacterium]